MLLGASGEPGRVAPDVRAVTDGGVSSGLPAGEALAAFAEAVVRREPEAVSAARERVRGELGDAAAVDAAAVIGSFERMVRVADGTGIPLDDHMAMVSADLRERLGIDGFGGAAGTPAVRGLKRWLGRGMARVLPLVLRRFHRR